MIKIVKFNLTFAETYQKFILSNPDTLIYTTIEYRDFLASILGDESDYLIALKENDIVGVLPYFSSRDEKVGRIINSLPWFGSYGGCVVAQGADDSARQKLLAYYRKEIDQNSVAASTLVMSPYEHEKLSLYKDIICPTHQDERVCQMTLFPDSALDAEEEMMAVFKKKTRNLVRKSLNQGFELVEAVDEDWAWQSLYDLHVENMEGKKAKPWSHFEALRKHIPAPWRRIYIAKLDGVNAAALLLLYFNKTVEYFVPAIKHEFRSLQPLSFLIWCSMRDAVTRGYSRWNWGGTWLSQSSLYHFKAGWGATDLPYRYLTRVNPDSFQEIKSSLGEIAGRNPYYYILPFNSVSES